MVPSLPDSCATCALCNLKGAFCAQLSPEALIDFEGDARAAILQRGDSIASRDLRSWPIIAVGSGVLSIQHLLEDGRKSIAAFFMPGDILDLRGIVERMLGQVIALGNATICRLSPDGFEQIVHNNPGARTAAWDALRSQSLRAMDHASDLAKKRALEKLASFIFECRRHYALKADDGTIRIPVRRIDLADYLGMQPETVSRCFRDLEAADIISFKSLSAIVIENLPILRRIANGDKAASAQVSAGDMSIKILRFA